MGERKRDSLMICTMEGETSGGENISGDNPNGEKPR